MSADTRFPRYRLCDLSILLKISVTALILVLLGGLYASVKHLQMHHENRDEVPGVSLNDIKGAYHGVEIRAPLLVALERGHPDNLPPDDRKVLIDWLQGGKVSIDYDNLDLGDKAPAEIIAQNCISCHADKASDPVASKLSLESFDKLKQYAFTKKIDPPPFRILVLSTHTHALSLGTMSFVVAALLVGTRLPRGLSHTICMLMGVGLATDIAAWWIARDYINAVYAIIIGGGIYNASTVLALVLSLLDMWFPRFERD